MDTYRTFHPTTVESISSSEAHGAFFKIDYILHKASLNKYRKAIPCILSDHGGIGLQMDSEIKPQAHTNSQRLNNTQLKDE